MSGNKAQIVELVSFEKYSLWLDGKQGGQSQTKAERDLTKMRFHQVFTEAYDMMLEKTGGRVMIYITVEKAENLSSLSKILQFKH